MLDFYYHFSDPLREQDAIKEKIMAQKTLNFTTTTSPEDVIIQAIHTITGNRWRVESQGSRNAIFVREENKFKLINMLVVFFLLLFFVIPGLIALVLMALRQPRIEGRIILTATQNGRITTVTAQTDGKGAERRVQKFFATLPAAPDATPSM